MSEHMLKVSEIIESDTAVSTDDGNILFSLINEVVAKKEVVVLDFDGIEIMTTAFLNAAIGQLYSIYQSDQLNACIRFENVSNDDRILFKKVVERAKQYFSAKQDFSDSVNDALDNG